VYDRIRGWANFRFKLDDVVVTALMDDTDGPMMPFVYSDELSLLLLLSSIVDSITH